MLNPWRRYWGFSDENMVGWMKSLMFLPKRKMKCPFKNLSSTTHRNPGRETSLIQNLELMLPGSSQMTTSAQWCLYPFHPYRLQSSFTIITASSTCIGRILRCGMKRYPFFFSVPMWVKMKYVCQVESISPYRRMPQSNNAHGTIKHQWTKCTINDYNKTQNLS